MRDLLLLFFLVVPRRPWLCALALGLPALAGAQPQAAADLAPAAVPQAAGAPLVHPALAVQPLPGSDGPLADWRAAHQAVGAFPRGHADIVRWEAGQGSAPVQQPMHHQGHKP